ncbi:AIG1 family-domain-containing protein [Glomus cerebriforme]|uniref:AIG1 family-domain-containing protein n=1 Tax=Glomus cerebriforme TaxID=658196 RepID=A0A397T9Z8_9GLOM|nr:AIG1 family-domain-containing protein [Glomus cerebriforme]
MVTRKAEEINKLKEELRQKLPPYSSDDVYSEEEDEEIIDSKRNSKGKSTSGVHEEINSFRYPAILLIGDAGVGKSTLGNWLLGYHGDNGPFETKASCDPVTLEPQTSLIEINDRKYNLIDTPGLFDVKDDARSEIALTKLANTINHCSYGIQAIIFVVRKAFGKEIDRRIQAIQGFLGEKSLDHMVIAFTHVNMDQTMDRRIMKQSFSSRMIKFLDRIDNRWIVSPHPDLFNLDDDIVYTNVYEAKDIIDSFPEAYTTEMFNKVRSAREEAEETARREERIRSCEEELEKIRREIDRAGRESAKREVENHCFSLDTIVILESGEKIEMSKVKIGDKIACDVYNSGGISKLKYSEVYLIAHVDKHKETEFLKVEYTKPDGMTGN